MPTAAYRRPERVFVPKTQPALSVLVLDDNPGDRMLLAECLVDARVNASVDEAADLSSFLQAIDRRSYDLVFIDQDVPGGNGIEALFSLTTHHGQRAATAILFTGLDQPDMMVDAMRGGCVDVLRKEALTPERLRAAIARSWIFVR